MGGRVPRQIKEKVIREWIQGALRKDIAENNNLGEGTVQGIIKEAKELKEYHDMDLFRQLALALKENEIEPFELAFAIRIEKIMEQNNIDEDQLESHNIGI